MSISLLVEVKALRELATRQAEAIVALAARVSTLEQAPKQPLTLKPRAPERADSGH